MANLFMDWTNGNNSNNGTSFALRVKDMATGATSGRTAAGDTWRMMKSEDPVSLGQTATWTNKSDTVTLNSALTKNIDTCDAAWTAVGANVTQSNPATRKEGTNSIQFNVAAAFTTGQIAYHTMASTDFSAYNKITLWILPSAAIASGVLKIVLCSDTVGTVAVNTFTINEALGVNSWRCITFDTGGALGATIQSVSLNAISDPGTVNIQLDNILAANNLTLSSLISTNSTATGYGTMNWYPIKSINGTIIKLDGGDIDASVTGRGFDGATVTATTYKIEPIRVAATGQTTNKAGTNDTTRITFSGGWDATNMTSQTGLTFLDWGDGLSVDLSISFAWCSLDHVVIVRGGTGISSGGPNANFDNCAAIGCGSVPFSLSGAYQKITNCEAYNNGNGFNPSGAFTYVNGVKACNAAIGTNGIVLGANNATVLNLTGNNNSSSGVNITGTNIYFNTINAKDNGASGLATTGGFNKVINITTSGNTSAGITVSIGCLQVDKTACTDTTPFIAAASASRLQISRIGNDPTAVKIYDGSTTLCIQSTAGTVHGSAAIAFEHSPQSVHINQYFPLTQKVGAIACQASGTLTLSVWVQRSSQNIVAQLLVRGGQVDGVASDLTAQAAAANNTWEQLIITCTPTQGVPIIVEFQTWQNTSTGNAFFSDFAASQIIYSAGSHKKQALNLLNYNLFGEPMLENKIVPDVVVQRSYLGRGNR